jgi:hypothetical protein
MALSAFYQENVKAVDVSEGFDLTVAVSYAMLGQDPASPGIVRLLWALLTGIAIFYLVMQT